MQFEQFLNGVESPELAPLIGVHKLQRSVQNYNFDPLFSSVLTGAHNGHVPNGEWKTTLATRFDRTIYNLSIITTVDEDKTIVDAFNSAANRSRFNFFYRNCSNETKTSLNLILPEHGAIGDRVGGLSMEVPKGLAKTLVERATEHPELQLRVERYIQLPGTFGRSRHLLKYFETDGDFYIDTSNRGPWMRLRLSGPEWHSIGLSESQVLAGSPRLAFLVLATVIDYNLSQSEGRREHIDYMEGIFGLLRQTPDVTIAITTCSCCSS